MKKLLIATLAAGVTGGAVNAAEKVTYEDHVLPVFRNACLKCHNADKAKADLDLSTFSGVMKGGSSGLIVAGGDADGSKLIAVITHAEEPTMPPNGKLTDKEIELVKHWVTGGLLETSGSKAIITKPKINLTLDKASFGKPEGPPPMPGDLLLEPAVVTEQLSVSTALAASPWAPLVAVGGQRQILLYNTDTLQLAGVLPFPEGYPHDLKFSRNGKLLIAGGGRGAHTGLAAVWDVTSGDRILSVGQELDAALAADISSNQKYIALGLPTRLVKIFSTETGAEIAKMKKHTDWVTALEFSPDSKFLATGDRGGGIVIWEADTGREVSLLNGHRGAITAINWQGVKLVTSASEDGSVKLWNAVEGEEVRNTRTHNATLHAAATHDGSFATCGRDNAVNTWAANGSRKLSISVKNDMPVRVAISHDGQKVVGTSFAGRVYVWETGKGALLGELNVNPPPLDRQVADMEKRAAALQAGLPAREKKLADAAAALQRIKDQIATRAKERDASVRAIEQKVAAMPKLEADSKTALQALEKKQAEAAAAVKKAQDQLAAAKKGGEPQAATVKKLESGMAALTKQEAAARVAVQNAKTALSKLIADNGAEKGRAPAQIAAIRKAKDDAIKNLEKAVPGAVAQETAAKDELKNDREQLLLARNTVERLKVGRHFTKLYYARQDFEAVKFEQARAQAQLESAESMLKRSEAGLTGVKAALVKKDEEKRSLEAQLQQLEKSIKLAREETTAAKATLTKVKQTVEAKEKEVARLDQEFKKQKAAAMPAQKPVAQAGKS